MKINHEFTVRAPIEVAWALLTDVEAIAPCLPGAQLTGVRPSAAGGEEAAGSAGSDGSAGETYEGRVKVKLGPVVAEYKGTAAFIEKDDEKFRGVIDAKGRDSRGQGNASAVITVQLREDGEGTAVGLDTDLKISGKIAQFGAGMIQEVSEKLLGQFVDCLEAKLAAPAAPVAAPVASEPVAAALGATHAPAEPVRSAVPAAPEPEALDLLDLAGGAAFKRLLPLVVAGVVAVAAVIFFFTRR